MNVTTYQLSFYVSKIEQGEPFSFSRFGDGEWLAILGAPGKNCDGCDYFPGLGFDLAAAVLARRSYFYALGPKARNLQGDAVEHWLTAQGVDLPWHSTEVWLTASLAGGLFPLTRALQSKRVLYVGPEHLGPIAWHWFNASFMPIPAVNAYLEKEKILVSIYRAIRNHDPEIIAFSAGMLTNVLIDALYPEIGEKVTMLDLGSVFDVYAGKRTRRYMTKGYDWATLANMNRYGLRSRPRQRPAKVGQ